jgi:hypothetical protein
MRSPRRAFLSTLVTLPLVPPATSAANASAPPSPAVSPDGGLSDGLLAAARAQYHLAPDEVEDVRKGIDLLLDAAERLRATPLVNSDEPVLTFEARPPALRDAGRRA